MAGDDLPTVADWIRKPAWMRDAACKEHPEIHWIPGRGASTEAARAVCDACLVRRECLAHALAVPCGA